jgi:murein DD-endopeptidase MepM/ murein hydrolase activator NlpD
MIRTQSRFHTIFGGAAGYIALTFVLLLLVFHLQENYDLVPARTFSADPPVVTTPSPKDTVLPIPGVTPDVIIPKSIPLKPSDLLPKPEDYADDLSLLRGRQLVFPLRDMPRTSMKNTFRDARGGGRQHEGVDILAPRNTPVVAIENGKIGRLWKSDYGGITIYQMDPTNSFVYYYAHLEKYAQNLKEGMEVKQGQVIGYVGTSGNAPPNTPHLHFAIYRAAGGKENRLTLTRFL